MLVHVKPKRRSTQGSFRRLGFIPDPEFPGSWIPDLQKRARLVPIAVAIVRTLLDQPGIGVRKLRAAVRGCMGRCTDADTEAALYMINASVTRKVGFRGAHRYTIDVDKLPPDVRVQMTPRR